ncbi:hypothetical protein [Fibrivirga algicola]|uniref:DUF1735 domain-containing protein n=1 Tax=Fibrivirga algicola TaxID=2950420 RepID=A0ABX0QJB0_9BACT|nr:hypothetical protein [Fibrivirga algicola]ARK12023.1 hypothetical protein A6C57_17745 [Fibrella sp. ES10-3-2-2]NID11152.1 hypothetical protein [Fibrivirga algicola]
MTKTIIKSLLLALLIVTSWACKDDLEYGPLVRDNRPAIPVTFPGATTFGGNPFINVPATSGAISFTLSIPSTSGRTIKEITSVAGVGTGTNAASLTTASSVLNTAPIPGTGTTAVYTTSVTAIKTRFPATVITPSADPYTPRELAFIFLVTLDDNTQIVTQQVRARLVP